MSVNKKPTEREVLLQDIKEMTRQVTNQKAQIFDLLEDKTKIMNDIEGMKQKIEEYNKNILNQQKILDGNRKVLNEKKKILDEKYPEVTVEK